MEKGDGVLDVIFEDENLEDADDVEMMDVEDGEIVGQNLDAESDERAGPSDGKTIDMESRNDNPGQSKSRKKKKKRKKGTSGSKITDINRFVIDVCKRMKERKSYLVWTAVGCLGVSAFSDLIKEVEAIQVCGGQKTADGGRYRNGGGILWNILKVRDPNAFKEIMRKGKEFEKQFKPQNLQQEPQHNKMDSSKAIISISKEQSNGEVSDGFQQQSKGEQKRASVHDRVRIPVAYDDLLEGENPKDQET